MMRIAYEMESLSASDTSVVRTTRKYLALSQHRHVNPDQLLLEMAQWYGLLVPVDDDHWTFVHKTIHDYLAARYWVESGEFEPHQVTDWNACAAYAACLSHNATKRHPRNVADLRVALCIIGVSLQRCFIHAAHVTTGLIRYFTQRGGYQLRRLGDSTEASVNPDIFALASDDFVTALADGGVSEVNRAADLVLAFALAEACKRPVPLRESVIRSASQRLGTCISVESETRGRERFAISGLAVAETSALAPWSG